MPVACAATEWFPRASITTSAEPGLNFRDLGQLLRRELAFQGINRLHEVLRVAAPFDRMVGKSPRTAGTLRVETLPKG